MSDCLIEGKPPFGQERECSTVKWDPQTQLVGTLEGSHPYLRARASLKAPLCNEKPNSSRGRAVSQVEAPFSCARSTAYFSEALRADLTLAAEDFTCS